MSDTKKEFNKEEFDNVVKLVKLYHENNDSSPNLINDKVIMLFCYITTINEIEYVISQGFDLKYKNYFFIRLCSQHKSVEIVDYLLCIVPIESLTSEDILISAIHGSNINVLKYLLDKGHQVTDDIIAYVCCSSNLEIIKIFLNYGVDPEKIGIFYFKHLIRLNNINEKIINFLNDNDVDFNSIIKSSVK